jgi:hypothetical protein
MLDRPERETLEATVALKALMVRGAITGPWHEDQVARFRRDCSEFLGEHGETILAALAAAPDARLADPSAAARELDQTAGTQPDLDARLAEALEAVVTAAIALRARVEKEDERARDFGRWNEAAAFDDSLDALAAAREETRSGGDTG